MGAKMFPPRCLSFILLVLAAVFTRCDEATKTLIEMKGDKLNVEEPADADTAGKSSEVGAEVAHQRKSLRNFSDVTSPCATNFQFLLFFFPDRNNSRERAEELKQGLR
jgi:hypothetical protein